MTRGILALGIALSLPFAAQAQSYGLQPMQGMQPMQPVQPMTPSTTRATLPGAGLADEGASVTAVRSVAVVPMTVPKAGRHGAAKRRVTQRK